MFKRTSKVLFVSLFISILVVACGGNFVTSQANGGAIPTSPASADIIQPSTSASTKTSQPTLPAAPTSTEMVQPSAPVSTETLKPTLPAVSNGENGGGGEAGGGVEGALVTYSNVALGFAIGHPGPWTQDPSFTNGVKFVGGEDSMTLELVTLPAGTDAMAFAQSDVAAVTAAFPGFKKLSLAPSTEVKNAIILGFNADGKSPVTGKTFTAHDERYYMPLADGRIAILTVVGPEDHYDSQGVRDIALTFMLTK